MIVIRDAARLYINTNWSEIINTLTYFMNTTTENNTTRNEARGLKKKIESSKTCITSIIWVFFIKQIKCS